MIFASPEFLFGFLPATILLCALAPNAARNLTLLLASVVFYAWGGGATIVILLCSIGLNLGFGILAQSGHDRGSPSLVRASVVLCVAANLAILGYFKYANFFVAQINDAAVGLGSAPVTWTDVALPIGISFYTFQAMSYVFDVARGSTRALRNPIDFALYIAMFPQLIAGPIVRFKLIADQLRHRVSGWSDFVEGAHRFAWGLVKKALLADPAGEIAAAAFAAPEGSLPMPSAWLGLIAYTLQIYFDFSAYSDMAIGLGRVFGFTLPENFHRPYSAVSLTDFWRRWHMTLSQWLRDYLYVPLGGSRRGAARTYLNLWIVFLATGLWHGASWTFVLWGAYHGAGLVIERLFGLREADGRPPIRMLRRLLTLFVVMMGWVLFRADDLPHALAYYAALFTPDLGPMPYDLWAAATNKNLFAVAVGSLVFLLPGHLTGGDLIARRSALGSAFATMVFVAALPLALLWIISGSYSAFLYFRF